MEKGKCYNHLQKGHGQPHYNPFRSYGARPLGAHLGHMEEKMVIWNSQHDFYKVKIITNHLIAFYDKTPRFGVRREKSLDSSA